MPKPSPASATAMWKRWWRKANSPSSRWMKRASRGRSPVNSPSPLAGEGKLSRSDSRERGRRISKLRGRAKEMRAESTDAEHRLWQLLRAHRFAGYKFRRQVPIDFYIADFVCFARRLIVEIDG